MDSSVKQFSNCEGVGRATVGVGDDIGLLAGTSLGRSSEPWKTGGKLWLNTVSRGQRMLLAETTVKDVDVCNIKLWMHIHSAYVPYQTSIIQNI